MALELDVDNKAARFQNCVNYHGQMENNLKHGHGTGTFSDGSTYEGDWLEGLPHGRGVWKNEKEMFEGDFLRGQFHGKGKHTLADDSVYEGDFQNDLRHGHGVLTNSESSVFDCEWFEGKKHGKGSEKLVNGDTFVGQYENDHKSNGLKTYFSPTTGNTTFEGSFSVPCEKVPYVFPHVGQYIYADGVSSTGDFRSRGKFTVCWPNGDSYVGQTCSFDDCTPHGFGTKTLKNKTVLTGKWRDGSLQRKSTWWKWTLLFTGLILVILFRNHMRSASVSRTNTTITYPDGGVYVGSLVNGTVRHGDGVMRFANGDVYNGTYHSDVMHGSGVYTYNSNTSIVGTVVYKGEWFNGSMVNRGQFDYLDGWFTVYGEWYDKSTTVDYRWGLKTDSVAWRSTCIGIGSNIVIPVYGDWVGLYVMTVVLAPIVAFLLFVCVILCTDPHTSTSQRHSAATYQPTPLPRRNSVGAEHNQYQKLTPPVSVDQTLDNTTIDIPSVGNVATVSDESQHQCPDCKRILSDLRDYHIHVKVCALLHRHYGEWQTQQEQEQQEQQLLENRN